MNKNSILFLLPCTNDKNKGGTHHYSSTRSLLLDISKENADNLLLRRENSFNIINNHQIYRTGQRISDLDYNQGLIRGRDISQKGDFIEEKIYIPAFNRYSGRIYTSLGEDRLSLANHTKSHILIISGLYGILKPEELIQLYSLNVSDSLDIRSNWVRKDVITDSLSDYIEKYKIKQLINFISVRNYCQLVNWEKLRNNNNILIYHPFSKQFAGDQFHPTLGKYLAFLLKKDEKDVVNILKQGIIQYGNLVDLYLMHSTTPDDKSLTIEINEYDMLDRVLRMEFNIFELLEDYENKKYDRKDHKHVNNFLEKHDNSILGRRLNDDFFEKRNDIVHELKDLSKEEWIAARDAYLEFISWFDANVKKINHFILHPID